MWIRRCCLLAAILALLPATPLLDGGTKKGTQYAILVAVSKYAKNEQWRPLPYTVEEMREFREVLVETGFAKENVEFLHDQQTEDRLRPTSANIVKKIKLMLDEISVDDTLLIALNGHGVQYKDDSVGFFCPVNADLADKKTLVPMDGKDGIYGLLESCKAKRKLLIVNACRHDPTRDLSFAKERIQLIDRDESKLPEGIAALFSCRPGQKSYYYPEEEKIQRSIFYHHLIEAWRGKYADEDKVTLDHVFDVVTRKTAGDARRIFSESQTPWPRRKYEGEWLLAKAMPATTKPKDNRDHARAIIEKAIKVHGGIENLRKMQTMRIKMEHKTENRNKSQVYWQMPDKYRSEYHGSFGGEDYFIVRVINGDKGWTREDNEPVTVIEAEYRDKWRNTCGDLGFLIGYPKEEYGAVLDEIPVNGKPAVGIEVTSVDPLNSKFRRYFDKASGHFVMHAWDNPKPKTYRGGHRVFDNFKETAGVIYPWRNTVFLQKKNDVVEKIEETTVTELEFLDKLDSKLFEMP